MKPIIALLVLLLVLLQYKLWLGDGSIPEVWRLNEALGRQGQENERLRERNFVLEVEVKDLKQGLEAVEERARRELGMIKEGETFYQVVEPLAQRSPISER
ncbi:MAG: cell division protein FtsB [Gammaproteobacteria bacterium]|nr:cell division protein FtsB [Gammaproteobacteria bacterium]